MDNNNTADFDVLQYGVGDFDKQTPFVHQHFITVSGNMPMTGWKCPECQTIWSPYTQYCLTCKSQPYYAPSTTGTITQQCQCGHADNRYCPIHGYFTFTSTPSSND